MWWIAARLWTIIWFWLLRLLKKHRFVYLSFIGLGSRSWTLKDVVLLDLSKEKSPKVTPKAKITFPSLPLMLFLQRLWAVMCQKKTLKSEILFKKGPFCPPTNQIELMSRILATGIQSEDTISQSASCNTTETGSKAQTARVSQQRW